MGFFLLTLGGLFLPSFCAACRTHSPTSSWLSRGMVYMAASDACLGQSRVSCYSYGYARLRWVWSSCRCWTVHFISCCGWYHWPPWCSPCATGRYPILFCNKQTLWIPKHFIFPFGKTCYQRFLFLVSLMIFIFLSCAFFWFWTFTTRCSWLGMTGVQILDGRSVGCGPIAL